MKIIFKKPKQKKILIFDREGLNKFKLFFYNSQFEVLDRRKESINIYIILITIFNDGFNDFKTNYFKNYLKTVNPKIVLTFIDNNFRFLLLKKTFPAAKYICIQNGMRDSKYFSALKQFKKIHKDLEVDYYFTFSNVIEKKISPYIKSKYFNVGSIINNHYSLDQKFKQHYFKKTITFISQFKSQFDHMMPAIRSEVIILKLLSKFCEEKKIKLNILGKIEKSEIKKFNKNFKFKIKWNFIPKGKLNETYKIVNSSNMIVYSDSTLGYEALSKGIRTVSFPIGSLKPVKNKYNKMVFGYPYRYPNLGFFWTNHEDKKKMYLILDKVYSCSINKWKRIYPTFKEKIMQYDKNNNKFKTIIKKIIKNLKFKKNY